MKVLSTILIFSCSMLINAHLYSQPDRSDLKEDRRLENLIQKLELEEDQIQDFSSILEKHKTSVKTIFDDSSLSRNEKKEALDEADRSLEDALSGTLDDVQIERFQQLKEDRRSKRKIKAERRKKLTKEGRANRKERKERMAPELKKWRVELEEYIEEDDKIKIAALREEMKAFKAEMKAFKNSIKEKRGELSKNEINELRSEFKETHASKKEALKELLEKYKDPIKEVLKNHKEEIKTRKVETREERKRLRGEERGKLRGERGEMKREKQRKHSKKRGKNHFAARFLLMDPEDVSETNSKEIRKEINLEIFPNPSNDYSTIKYQIESAGPVKIDLVDHNGNIVKNLMDEDKEKGSYELRVDLTNLQGHKYFIRLTDQYGVYSNPLILSK